ncbi:Methyltransferase domain-containing protein [Marinococcus luteus]|uniref:Methyltransferase domain-containing protein n=1 Tax=Marinococcus luteus TaxID=1122204 RepID=A0A1H2T5M4_9BACI|nr:class I SAM-dependent methyltransferase [Marinococcus luteus]SDW39253.1 Methyltransferase domain-containing protein [Marinococcus luteus]
MKEPSLEEIRASEKEYHRQYYKQHGLFEQGTWMKKPASRIINALGRIRKGEDVRLLDLGCGIGRNSIPAARQFQEQGCEVTCVDFLDEAITQLMEYAGEYGVEQEIKPVKKAIEEYTPEEAYFDGIIAVSSIEHVPDENTFWNLIDKLQKGTAEGGVHAFLMNTGIHETDAETNEELPAKMEVNFDTEDIIQKLARRYEGWTVHKLESEAQSFSTYREDRKVLINSNMLLLEAVKERA